jgi:SAM-dependent methyltransferase
VREFIIPGVSGDSPQYLRPYLSAAQRHGAEFSSLLWASPKTQGDRFDAIAAAVDLVGKSVLDVGCGRADFLDYLVGRGIVPSTYVGIEAVPALAEAARAKPYANVMIVEADFVDEPSRLFVGAQAVVISGALNTMDDGMFYASIRRAYDAASECLVFNFLSSPRLAGTPYLHWRRAREVERFARDHAGWVTTVDEYLPGDCTIVMGRRE